MKPAQLARLLGISGSGLRERSDEFAEFVSLNAAGGNGAHRIYDDIDARVIAWITTLRAKNTSKEVVRQMLHDARADNWRNLPPLPSGMANDEPIAVIPREAAEERLTAIQERYELQVQSLVKERDELQAQIAELKIEREKERDELQSRLTKTAIENTAMRERLDAVTDQLIRLNERLTGLLEKEQKRRK